MGILQAQILEWVAMPSSRGSSQPRDRTQVSHIAGRFFTIWATREATVDKAVVNVRLQKFVDIVIIPRWGMAGSYGSSVLFLRPFPPVSRSGCTNLHPANSAQDFPFPHSLTSTSYSSLFDNSQSNRCEGIAPCGFALCLGLTTCQVSVP